MQKIITRFAPSLTGMLHVGNSRVALANWLYARKNHGQFILRFDDTDLERSKVQYKEAMEEDLRFLGLNWDQTFNQSSRLERYRQVKELLLAENRLYPCFETPEELALKRKSQLSRGLPPIYDRASVHLTKQQIDAYIKQGKTPHYRFLMSHTQITWDDLVKGTIRHEGQSLSDPIIIRADGSMTYMLCSVVDDIDYNITHIIRGEDHVSNTAVQIQMFEALHAKIPTFGHLSLLINREKKISKRIGGFDIASLRDQGGFEPMAVASFFALLGAGSVPTPFKTMDSLIKEFNISNFSHSPTTYQPEDLARLNHKLLLSCNFAEIKERLEEIGDSYVTEEFWQVVRPNLRKLSEIKDWWDICYSPAIASGLDKELLSAAMQSLPSGEITDDSWSKWTSSVAEVTHKKGKELFLPLRLALTGRAHGPEMSAVLPLISREEILRRLSIHC